MVLGPAPFNLATAKRTGAMSGVDDLLRELDDIPSTSYPQTTPPARPTAVVSAPMVRVQAPPKAAAAALPKPSLARPKNHSDFDLSEFDDIQAGPPPSQALSYSIPVTNEGQSRRSSAQLPRLKCLTLFIGGSSLQRGRQGSQPTGVRCCDQVRCTKCDFRVATFPNQAWSPDVDYMFFRNNYPTEAKLAQQLRPAQGDGAWAYACQCSWTTVIAAQQIDFSSDLRWVCGGHDEQRLGDGSLL